MMVSCPFSISALSASAQGSFVFPDGARYTGEAALLDGILIRSGSGKNEQADGTVYSGEWKLDKMHGQGLQHY